MKIDLEYPYNTLWNNGYIVINPEGRRNVVLFNSQIDRSTVSFARYLMSVKLGRFLTDQEEVDHIDDNKTNDDPNNLQILTPEQNREKQRLHYINNVQQKFELVCPNCGCNFSLTEREMNGRFIQIRKNASLGLIYCSSSCSSIFNKLLNPTSSTIGTPITDEKIKNIKRLKQQGFSSYKISELTGVSRNTVMKYW